MLRFTCGKNIVKYQKVFKCNNYDCKRVIRCELSSLESVAGIP